MRSARERRGSGAGTGSGAASCFYAKKNRLVLHLSREKVDLNTSAIFSQSSSHALEGPALLEAMTRQNKRSTIQVHLDLSSHPTASQQQAGSKIWGYKAKSGLGVGQRGVMRSATTKKDCGKLWRSAQGRSLNTISAIYKKISKQLSALPTMHGTGFQLFFSAFHLCHFSFQLVVSLKTSSVSFSKLEFMMAPQLKSYFHIERLSCMDLV